jgi:type II secretory pathway pseudopilin PulG
MRIKACFQKATMAEEIFNLAFSISVGRASGPMDRKSAIHDSFCCEQNGRHASSRGGRARGFTVIEAVVTVAIMGLLFVVFYSAIPTTMSLVKLCRENERVTQILTEKFETIRLYSWDQVNSNGFIPAAFTVGIDPSVANSLPYYTGTVTIVQAPIAESYQTNLLQITVEVNWVSCQRLQTRTMSSFFSKYGLQTYYPTF